MVRNKRSAVQKYHDRVAPRYDESYNDDYWKWHDSLTWDYIKPHLPKDQRAAVLDLGCGTGKWAAKLVKSGFPVTCVDISLQMLDQARKTIKPLDRNERTHFIHADLCDLSALSSDTYSLAIAMGDAIGCTDSPLRAMKQIRRILAPKGILIATLDNRLAAIDYYLEKGEPATMKKFLRDGKTHWLTRDVEERFDIFTYSPDGVRKLIESSGFKIVEMIGKTILPMRYHRNLLASSADRRLWSQIEKSLCRNVDAVSRASHLQFVCQLPEETR